MARECCYIYIHVYAALRSSTCVTRFLSSDQSSGEEQKRDRKGGKERRSGSESESEEESESESSESESESEEESESDTDIKKKKKVWACSYITMTLPSVQFSVMVLKDVSCSFVIMYKGVLVNRYYVAGCY